MKPRQIIALALFALLIAIPSRAQPPEPEQRRIFESYGMFSAAVEDSEGGILLTLWDPEIRFRVPAQPEGKVREMESLVRRAAEGSRAVTIGFDGLGRVNQAAGTIDYPLCSIRLDDVTFGPETPCAKDPPPPPSGESALALARAHHANGDLRTADRLIRRAASDGEPAFRKLLLRVRGQIADGVGTVEEPNSPAADRAFVAALKDYRDLAELAPDDVEVQFMIGLKLEQLGDYAAAKQLYERILGQWPDEDYRIAVRLGALYRTQGDNARALAELDSLVARNGPQPGMRFHYHRGWTLTRLGRFEEAVAEITEGLRGQPDYAYAYFRRGCAYASLGRLDEALADVERGKGILEGMPGLRTAPFAFDIRRAAAIIAELQAARAARPTAPVAGTCEGYWGPDQARARSPLLPPA